MELKYNNGPGLGKDVECPHETRDSKL